MKANTKEHLTMRVNVLYDSIYYTIHQLKPFPCMSSKACIHQQKMNVQEVTLFKQRMIYIKYQLIQCKEGQSFKIMKSGIVTSNKKYKCRNAKYTNKTYCKIEHICI